MNLEAVDSHSLFYERKLVSLELRKHRRCRTKARAAQTRLSGMHSENVRCISSPKKHEIFLFEVCVDGVGCSSYCSP